MDRKKERTLVFSMRKNLVQQLQSLPDDKPNILLHYAVVIVQSQLSGALLHAPSRAIGAIIQALKGRSHLGSQLDSQLGLTKLSAVL